MALLVWFNELDDAVLGVGDGDFGVKTPGWEDFLGYGDLGGADEEGESAKGGLWTVDGEG